MDPQVLMYRPQDILNSDTLVAGSLDVDDMRIALAVLQFQRQHGWIHGGGGYSSFGRS
jgi:hypothetical protein